MSSYSGNLPATQLTLRDIFQHVCSAILVQLSETAAY